MSIVLGVLMLFAVIALMSLFTFKAPYGRKQLVLYPVQLVLPSCHKHF